MIPGLTQVARRYRFSGMHHVPGMRAPWGLPHPHKYTVEVVASGRAPDGLVVDTVELDEAWLAISPKLNDLNADPALGDTTVETLARTWLARFQARVPEVSSVTVWEDDERWGRAE